MEGFFIVRFSHCSLRQALRHITVRLLTSFDLLMSIHLQRLVPAKRPR